MILPLNLKIGQISLNIESMEQENAAADSEIRLQISRSWNAIKEITDKHIDATFATLAKKSDPFSSNPKVKLMMAIFDALCSPEIEEKTLIRELLKTSKFSDETEALAYLKPAIIHGMIQERSRGLYIKGKTERSEQKAYAGVL
jgi:hypothetical protein